MRKYEVYVDDNYHFMDEDERTSYGQFETLDEAIAKCRAIVDASLRHLCKPGMSVRDLFDAYCAFGDDPWVKGGAFNAWHYARERCAAICAAVRQSSPGLPSGQRSGRPSTSACCGSNTAWHRRESAMMPSTAPSRGSHACMAARSTARRCDTDR